MQSEFKTIGIIGKPSDPSITETLLILVRLLKQQGYQIVVASDTAQFISDSRIKAYPVDTLTQYCDVVLAVGGDGTFLMAARAASVNLIPLIGINLGRVGFLVDISPDTMQHKLLQMLQGHYKAEQRHLLRTKIMREGKAIHEEISLNEVVVHRWVTPSMIKIVTHINGRFLNEQRSDGLIIATPTGSTAYSLSAGGPILHPNLNALVLVPLNPHTLTNRPIVIEDSAEIEISFCQSTQINALVTCDHLQIPDVYIGDRILIKKESMPIKILHPIEHDFFDTLRQKLHWSDGYQA